MSSNDHKRDSQDPASMPRFEQMEDRLLLTTLMGGEVFEYQNEAEETIRVALGGDIIVEIVGADVDDQQRLHTGGLPGTVFSSTAGRNMTHIQGGHGGVFGVELIGETPVDEPAASPPLDVGYDLLTVPDDEINLDGLASMGQVGSGATYAFNIGSVTVNGEDTTVIQLASVSTLPGNATATVEAMLHGARLNEDTMANILPTPIANPTAFSVDPITGIAYTVGGNHLWSVNRFTGVATDLGFITNTDTGNAIAGVSAIEFDATGQLYIITNNFDGDATVDASGRPVGTDFDGNPVSAELDTALVAVDKAAATFANADAVPITVGGLEPNDYTYTAMAFSPSGLLYAVAQRAEDAEIASYLQQIDLVTGVAIAMGAGPVAVDGDNAQIDGLAFAIIPETGQETQILVGMDRSQTDAAGAVAARLVRIDLTNGAGTPLCLPGAVASLDGLDSHLEPGDTRPLLFATDGSRIVRGSVVTLPMDEAETIIESIAGADFRPHIGGAQDDLLYFVARDSDSRDLLYTIDVRKASRSAIQNSLQLRGTLGSSDGQVITSLAWEVTSPTTDRLLAFRNNSDVGEIVLVDPVTGTVTQTLMTPITIEDEDINEITGIEFVRDDPTVEEGILYATDDGGDRLVELNLTDGTARELGPLPDGSDTDDPIRGSSLMGLAWNPVLFNVFTGMTGVLLATDTESDELVYIDFQERFPTAEGFQIYVSQAGQDASIAIARVPDPDFEDLTDERPMEPFSDAITVRTIDAQTGLIVTVTGPDGSGTALIGQQTIDDPDTPVDESDWLIQPWDGPGMNFDLVVDYQIGTRPAGMDDVPDPPPATPPLVDDTIAPGIKVVENLLEYVASGSAVADRMMGYNLDYLGEMAVASDGTTVVVDTDGIDIDGLTYVDDNGDGEQGADEPLVGDQVAIVGSNGRASEPVGIVDSVTGAALRGIQGLDYGDLAMDGNETLYAIMDVNDPVQAGSVGGDLGASFNIVGLTVAPGGAIYAVDDRGGAGTNYDLYLVDRDNTGAVTAFTLIGEIETSDTTDLLDGIDFVTGISALDANASSGVLYVAGVSPETGLDTLYALSAFGNDVDGDGQPEAFATELVALTNPAKAIASTPDGQMLYLVLNNGGADELISIDLTDFTITSVGNVQVAGVDTDIEEMDFLEAGVLLGVDRSGGAGQGRVVYIDIAVPGNSQEYSAPGTVLDTESGFTIDPVTRLSHSVSSAGGNDEVFGGSGDMPTLGILDPTTGFFTQLGQIGGGAIQGVRAMAFSRREGSVVGRQGLYVVATDNLLYEIDTATGAVIPGIADVIGFTYTDDQGATVFEQTLVESMDFDSNDQLFVQDLYYGRLLDVDLSTLGSGQLEAGQQTMTPVGSLRPTVGAISYDFSNDRFLAADNSVSLLPLRPTTGEGNALESALLMELLGVESDSAAGQKLDRVLIGGAVSGMVDVQGSIDTFYAGWMITGQGQGLRDPSSTQFNPSFVIPDNFAVTGDVRNLIAIDYGTETIDEPQYLTGFDMEIGGKVGWNWAFETFAGGAYVSNQFDTPGITLDDWVYQEIENKPADTLQDPEGVLFQSFQLHRDDDIFVNDTFDTPQYLGSIRSTTVGEPDSIIVSGSIQTEVLYHDNLDYYAVSLLAGQTITVQLNSSAPEVMQIGVFDPDGRLIATDESNVDNTLTRGAPFNITTDRPGIYRFAVGASPFDGSVTISSDDPIAYTLEITNAGDLGFAAFTSEDTVQTLDWGSVSTISAPITVERGDFGAVFGRTIVLGSGALDYFTAQGSLRAVSSASIGENTGPNGSDGQIAVQTIGGDVGLLQGTDAAGEVDAIVFSGGDVQTIDSAGRVFTELIANGGLGVLRGAQFGFDLSTNVGLIAVNADNVGQDGIIDLIDITGNFGNELGGGPPISTGQGGNVRYMRIGGFVNQDLEWFGGYNDDFDRTILDPGESVVVRDDGGGFISMAPLANTIDTGSRLGVDTPNLSYRTYGIRNSGGVALVDVESTGSVAITGDSHANGRPVEIGTITVQETTGGPAGRAVVTNATTGRLELEPGTTTTTTTDAITGLVTTTTTQTDIRVNIGGGMNNPVDVFEIVGPNLTGIANTTGGEIVNINATTIGSIETMGSVGVAKTHNSAAVNGATILSDAYPFSQQRIGVVSGNILNVSAAGAVGNFIVTGEIDTIVANSDGVIDHTDGRFDGVAAPIYASGNIALVQIGEGVAPAGTGGFVGAGIISGGQISTVTNQGLGSDIRGTILGSTGIDLIHLRNGSLIDANIYVVDPSTAALENPQGILVHDQVSSSGDILIEGGQGGIIGTYINAPNIGNIRVDGFGVLYSLIAYDLAAGGDMGDLITTGYGVQGVTFVGGHSQGDITATGLGTQRDALNYTSTVRHSENGTSDPIFNERLTPLNDLHQFMGTSATDSLRQDGQISGVLGTAIGDLGRVTAYQITGTQLDYANSIAGIQTRSLPGLDPLVNGLYIYTGHLGYFFPGSDVFGLNMNVAGRIDSVYIPGDLAGNSIINALGPNGDIRNVYVAGDMDGVIAASGSIGVVNIAGDFNGTIFNEGLTNARYALQYLKVGGAFSGLLDLTGDVGTIYTLGDFGAAGDSMLVDGDVAALIVGASPVINDSALNMDMNIEGDLGTLLVYGRLAGDVYVSGSLRSLAVYADAVTQGTAIVDGNVTVLNDLTSAVIVNGNVGDGAFERNIIVGDDLGSFVLVNGDIAPNATVSSSFGDITAVTIIGGRLGGAMRGAIHADSGNIGSVVINRSDLGEYSEITAENLNLLSVAGSVLTGARVDIEERLGTTIIGRNVLPSAVIEAGSAGYVSVGHDMLGDIKLGYQTTPTIVTVGRDLGGLLSVDSDTILTVRDDILAGGVVSIERDLTSLNVADTVSGNVFVDGSGGVYVMGGLAGGMLTTGFGLNNLIINGDATNSLVQVGYSRGDDGTFATGDPTETGRIANLTNLRITGAATDSIFAAGGAIGSASVSGAATNSSFSTGLSVGGTALEAVRLDATPLATIAEQNAARSGADRQLFHGDFGSARITGGLVNSDLTAGVDPGADGIFGTADDTVVTSLTGGDSRFGSLSAAADVNSNILADAGGLGTIVAYTIADLTPNNPLLPGNLIGSAAAGAALAYVTSSGHVVTVRVTGPGLVNVYDEAAGDTDDLVDALVIRNATSATSVAITTSTPGAVGIRRILTSDDSSPGSLSFDGDLVGDGTADADLWLDGPVRTITLRELGDDVTGRVGGDVTTLTAQTQGSGQLRVGGTVNLLNVTDSGANRLLQVLSTAPSADIGAMATDSADNVWVFDTQTRRLSQVNVNTGAVVGGNTVVIDAWRGAQALSLAGMDFDAADSLYAATTLLNQSPTDKVGNILGTSVQLNTLAVDANGRVMAIDFGTDILGSVDGEYDIHAIGVAPSTGIRYAINNNAGTLELTRIDVDPDLLISEFLVTSVGNLTDGVNDITGVEAMEVDAAGVIRLVGTRAAVNPGGDMELFTVDPTTGTATLVAALTDPAAVTDSIDGLALSRDGATMYALRNQGGVHRLYTVNIATGVMTEVIGVTLGTGEVRIDADGDGAPDDTTVLCGLDVDEWGNLISIDHGAGAGTGRAIQINLADPGLSTGVGAPGSVSARVCGLTSDAMGVFYTMDSTPSFDRLLQMRLRDRLVEIDPTTGALTPVGILWDIDTNNFRNNVMAMGFGDDGILYALVNDQDGLGDVFAPAGGVAIAKIETSDVNNDGKVRISSPMGSFVQTARLNEGAPVTDAFSAMALNSAREVYAIRRVGTQDHLVPIALNGQTVVPSADTRIQVGGADTNILGIGFAGDRLLAYNNDGVNAELIEIDTNTPGESELITAAGALDARIDAFAVGRTGQNAATYAYDTNGVVGGALYMNPGTVQTLGTVDLNAGTLRQLRPMAEDTEGTTLSASVIGLAVDTTDTGDVFVVTDDGRLIQYAAADGAFVAEIGTVADQFTFDQLDIREIDFVGGTLYGLDALRDRLVTIEHRYSAMTSMGNLGGDFNLQAMVVTPDDEMFAVNDNAGTFELYRIDRGPTGNVLETVLVGNIQDAAANAVTGIAGMEVDSSGNMYFVGTRPVVNAGGDMELFYLDETTGEAILMAPVTDPLVVTDAIEGLALSGDGMTMYALRNQAGTQRLYTLASTGLLTEVTGPTLATGEIRVDNDGDGTPDDTTTLTGLTRGPAGTILGIDNGAGAGTGRTVRINLDDPGLSTPINAPSSLAAGVTEYALGPNGSLFAVNGAASPDEILRAPLALATPQMESGAADGVDLAALSANPAGAVRSFRDSTDELVLLRGLNQGAIGHADWLLDVLSVARSSSVTSMATDAAGNFWAFDAATGWMSRVNLADGSTTVDPLPVTDNVTDVALNVSGLDFQGATLFGTAPVWNVSPTVEVGTLNAGSASYGAMAVSGGGDVFAVEQAAWSEVGELGGNFSVQALTVTSTGVIYAINDNAGTFELYRFRRNDVGAVTGFTRIGAIQAGGTPVDAINAIEASSGGTIYVVGSTTPGVQTLFTLNLTTGAATMVADLDDGAPVGDTIEALAFGEPGETLYAVRNQVGVHRLYQLDATTAAMTEVVGATLGTGELRADTNGDGTSDAVSIIDMDVDSDGTLLAVDATSRSTIRIYQADPALSWALDEPGSVSAGAGGFASDSTGAFYTVDSSTAPDRLLRNPGSDTLVQIDTTTGDATPVGTIRDIYSNAYYGDIMGLAFNNGGTLWALLRDADGKGGAFTPTDGVALARLQTADSTNDGSVRIMGPTNNFSPAVLLNDGAAVTDEVTGMSISSGGTIYAIRRSGGQDHVVTVATDGTTDAIGAATRVMVNAADTNIVGMGFAGGDLMAYNNDGVSAEMIGVNVADPDASEFSTQAGALSTGISSYAVGRGGAEAPAYGIDGGRVSGAMFYAAPGLVETFGIVSTAVSTSEDFEFLQLRGLAQDRNGTALTSAVAGMAIDNAIGGTGDLYVATVDGRLLRYDAADGSYVAEIGTIRDADTGETLLVTAIEFDDTTGQLIGIDERFDRLVTIEHRHTALASIGDLGADWNIAAMTVTPSDVMYAVDNNAGVFELYRVDRDAEGSVSGFTLVGDLNDGTNTITGAVSGVAAITASSEGAMYTVGTRLSVHASGDQELFTVDPLTGVVTSLGILTDVDGVVYDTIDSLAFGADGTLYAIRNEAGTQVLYTVDPVTTIMTEVKGTTLDTGEIRVDNDGDGVPDDVALLVGMTAGPAGDILGLDTGAGAGTGRSIRVNLDDPALSMAITPAGSLAAGLQEYEYGPDGSLYTVDAASSPDRILRNTLAESVARTEDGAIDGADVTDLTATAGGVFRTFSDESDVYAQLRGTTQADLGGILADSINRLNLGGGDLTYAGRVVTTGNTMRYVGVSGDFAGRLISDGDITTYVQTGGDFAGTLRAGGDITNAMIIGGEFTEGASIEADGKLTSLYQSGGDFAGFVSAATASVLRLVGDGLATADILVGGNVSYLLFTGGYAGVMDLGSITSLLVSGVLGGTIHLDGDASVINLLGGTTLNSMVDVGGNVRMLNVGQTHSGVIGVEQGVTVARLASLDSGILDVAEDTLALLVTGNTTDSVLSFGTWIGADGIYNTADDVITGGSITGYAYFLGSFRDSALVAGVLPDVQFGPDIPTDMRVYTGNTTADEIALIDSAEAGGILPSRIASVTILGNVINSSPSTGARSVVAAADEIGRTYLRSPGASLWTRVYSDPFGAPTLNRFDSEIINDSEVWVNFSEELNTSSLVLSQDLDGDQALTSLADVVGTVTVTDGNGDIVNDVVLSYTTRTDDFGVVYGVLILRKQGLFDGTQMVNVTFSGELGGPGIYDRSGLRSALRDLNQDGIARVNEDVAGTLFNGDQVLFEGENLEITVGPFLLAAVPAYEWWFGCAPTAAGMLVGYYDSFDAYQNLIAGDAFSQTDNPAIDQAIASSGDGQYIDGTTEVVPATPGTGHIGDYALYDSYNDEDDAVPYPDLSDPAVQAATTTMPHADNSLADFMETSWSINGSTFGGTAPGSIGEGVEEYFDSVGYADVVDWEYAVWGDGLTWDIYRESLMDGRPVLMGVDSNADGYSDHAIIGIGYNDLTYQYAAYNTWDLSVHWYDWTPTAAGVTYGVDTVIFFTVENT
jgi:hypothetical protein